MDRRYQLGTDDNKAWLKELREELFEFGKDFPSPGGGAYYLGDDGTPWKDRPRETWITSRMAHVYSIGAILYGDSAKAWDVEHGSEKLKYDTYGRLADRALSGLRGELHDIKHGGWYAGLASDGSILETKQCYAHAFVILAAASGFLAGRDGAEELLSDALSVYDKYFWDEETGLSVDTWNTEFTGLSEYRGLNANMHSVEAFLAVYDALGDTKYLDRAGRIIDHVASWAEENAWRIPEHFKSDWTPDLSCNEDKPDDPFKPYGATPGHGIEWARLITQWAAAMFNKDRSSSVIEKESFDVWNVDKGRSEHDRGGTSEALIKGDRECLHGDNIPYDIKYRPYIMVAENLYKRAVDDAWNCDGARGIVYTTDWNGKPVVHDRMHWTLAEAINTSAVLYRVTGDERYASDYAEFIRYLDEVVHDKINGSWFHQLDRNNKVIGTVWPGKSDIYHALQATLIPYNERVGVSIAKAVKEIIV